MEQPCDPEERLLVDGGWRCGRKPDPRTLKHDGGWRCGQEPGPRRWNSPVILKNDSWWTVVGDAGRNLDPLTLNDGWRRGQEPWTSAMEPTLADSNP